MVGGTNSYGMMWQELATTCRIDSLLLCMLLNSSQPATGSGWHACRCVIHMCHHTIKAVAHVT
jgi:hypothetical protein